MQKLWWVEEQKACFQFQARRKSYNKKVSDTSVRIHQKTSSLICAAPRNQEEIHKVSSTNQATMEKSKSNLNSKRSTVQIQIWSQSKALRSRLKKIEEKRMRENG
ncbi:uncharacterized protein DS421_16g545810 [Arachis hypogaea]|nr:uncharacterized protein DS421_16g545810 [Arachis hypogaea]